MSPSWPPREGIAGRLRQAVSRRALRWTGAHEVADIAALQVLLRRPDSILCLGNGPSSEHAHIPLDCASLFRVNWVWRARDLLTGPDVVFTADPDLPPPGSRAILGFPTFRDAARILGIHRRAGGRPATWFSIPELAPDMAAVPRAAYPTNGALMIAVAAALEPARLVIAGIDLYDDPRGKYPGDSGEPNEYAAIHDVGVEIDFIRAALAGYRGALVILSDNLRAALASHG